MTNMKSLSMNDLRNISGGGWDYDTITDEERFELDAIFDEMIASGTLSDANARLDDFIDRMDAKYGPNEPL